MFERKTLPVELKVTAEGDTGSFEGRASTFNSVDSYGDITVPGAFKASLPDFLKRGFIGMGHDWHTPIGMVIDAREEPDGLYIKGQFHSTAAAQEARVIAKERSDMGQFVGLSIGYQTEDYEMRDWDTPVRNQFGEMTDQVRALTKIKLYEVSLVTVPAEPKAGLTAIKGFDLSIEDHSGQLRVALQEFVMRCKAGAAERVKVGRAISATRRTVIESVSGSLRAHADDLEALLAPSRDEETEPQEETVIGLNQAPLVVAGVDLRALRKQFDELDAFYSVREDPRKWNP